MMGLFFSETNQVVDSIFQNQYLIQYYFSIQLPIHKRYKMNYNDFYI